MRKSRMAEKYVRVVNDMYDQAVTSVRYAAGMTESLKVEAGLLQRSTDFEAFHVCSDDGPTDKGDSTRVSVCNNVCRQHCVMW